MSTLSQKEALQKWKEEKDRELDKFRLPDQQVLSDFASRVGRPLSHSELVQRITKLSDYKLWAEESNLWNGGMNFYTMMWEDGKQIKICCNSPFLKGYLPEYTVIHPNQRNMPDRRTPGWREVIFRLVAQRFLDYKKVEKVFGKETPTPSDRWLKNIQPYR